MTRTNLSFLKTFALTALLAAAPGLFASETGVATVSVPFAFRAGNTTLPAGVYKITKSEQSVIFLRNGAKTVALLSVGSATAAPSGSNLVRFEKIEGETILKEVLVDGGQGFLLKY
jgi:hypothetical protein